MFYFPEKTKTMKKLSILIMLVSLCVAVISSELYSQDNRKKVAVLYNNTPTGKAYLKGVQKAHDSLDVLNNTIRLDPVPYSKAADGEAKLKALIADESTYVILGPTESEIFVRVEKLGEAKNKPIISGLVTAEEGNKENGCFFRINLDVNDRVNTVWNHINKYWISSMAIIYQNSEFGRRAEKALKNRIDGQRISKTQVSYRIDPGKDFSEVIKRVVKQRPEVVALFCDRELIPIIYRDIMDYNDSGVKYAPIFFTIIDICKIHSDLGNFYFPSLIEYDTIKKDSVVFSDEVDAFGFDNGLILEMALTEYNGNQDLDAIDGETLNNNIVSILSSAGEIERSETGMILKNMKNYSRPYIYEVKEGEVIPFPIYSHVHWIKQFVHKVVLIFSVFGEWIWLNVVIITLITFLICRMDLRRSFPRKHVKILLTGVFWLYFFINLAAVFLIYLFLAETGSINYTDPLMAIIISVTPSAFMKTTFFETRQGKSIGLEGLYKRIMTWMDKKIMEKKYKHLEPLTNTVAYYNAQNSMRNGLLRVYRNHPSTSQTAKMIQKMEEDMNNEKDYLNRRRVLAKLLMRQFDIDQLRAEGFLPQIWDCEKPFDPQKILRIAARNCAESDKKITMVENHRKEKMNDLRKLNKDRYNEVKDFYEKEREITMTVEGNVLVNMRIILVVSGFNLQWFFDNELLNEDEVFPKEDTDKKGNKFGKKTWGMLRNLFPSFSG